MNLALLGAHTSCQLGGVSLLADAHDANVAYDAAASYALRGSCSREKVLAGRTDVVVQREGGT